MRQQNKKIDLAGCLIIDPEGRVLLMQRTSLVQWELPGGKVEAGEDFGAAARREMLEELGIEVRIMHKAGSKEFNQDGIAYDYTWFVAVIAKGTPQIIETEKFDRIRYFSWEEMRKECANLSKNVQNLSDAYFRGSLSLEAESPLYCQRGDGYPSNLRSFIKFNKP